MNSTSPAGNSPANVVPNPELFKRLLFCGLAGIAIVAISAWMLLGVSILNNIFDVGQTLFVFLGIYIASSFKEVQANEVGAAFFYGKALKELASGLQFIPFGLMQIKKGPRTVQEFQCPGEPENVQKTDDKIPLEPGMVRPIRVVTGSKKDMSDDILDTRMTLVLSFFTQWAITDVLDYTSNYGSTAEIEKQVRDIGEAVLAEIATKHTPSTFIANLSDQPEGTGINQSLTNAVGDRFKNSGVRIISTRLISPDVSHEVSKALAAIPEARAKSEQAKVTAEGEKVKFIKEGEGKAAAKLAMLTAEADGRKKMMEALGVDGNAVLASEAVAGILAQTDVLVMGQGGTTDAMGLVKAAQSALNSGKKGA